MRRWTVIGTRCDISGEVYGAVVLPGHVEYVAMEHGEHTHQFVYHLAAATARAAVDEAMGRG